MEIYDADKEVETQNPWFQNGLRFKCTECGKCCTGTSGFVWVEETEIEAMAASLKISIDLFKRKYLRKRDNRYALVETKSKSGDYDCIFLKENKCQIYLQRPLQCRTYPWWPENLNSPASWQEASDECEGINDQAPLVPYSQIIQLGGLNVSTD